MASTCALVGGADGANDRRLGLRDAPAQLLPALRQCNAAPRCRDEHHALSEAATAGDLRGAGVGVAESRELRVDFRRQRRQLLAETGAKSMGKRLRVGALARSDK